MVNNFSKIDDEYSVISAVKCNLLNYFGIYYLILFIISIISNIAILYILAKNRKSSMIRGRNILILVLVLLNLLGTIVALPIVIMTSFSCRYVFKNKSLI